LSSRIASMRLSPARLRSRLCRPGLACLNSAESAPRLVDGAAAATRKGIAKSARAAHRPMKHEKAVEKAAIIDHCEQGLAALIVKARRASVNKTRRSKCFHQAFSWPAE